LSTQNIDRYFKHVLHKIYLYLHASYLYHKLTAQSQDLKSEICTIKIDIRNDFSDLDVEVTPTPQIGEQLMVPIQAPQKYVQNNNLESMMTFIKMLKMPVHAFKHVIPILTSVIPNGISQLAFEMIRSNPSQIPFEHNIETNEVCFRIAFHRITMGTPGVLGEKIISLGLRFNYSTGLLSIWEPASTDIIDLFTTSNNSVPRDVPSRLSVVLRKIQEKLK